LGANAVGRDVLYNWTLTAAEYRILCKTFDLNFAAANNAVLVDLFKYSEGCFVSRK